MDMPIFHLDFFGNRVLFAVIAILHVIINHAMAVGAVPLVATMEYWGRRTGDARWDQLAYRILAVCFIITTTLGALTGVGIWLSASLVNPTAIGSLIRVFFWAWFFEWTVFVTEIVLILLYFLTWKNWGARHKGWHISLGFALSFFSWLTMAVIVAILGFMMDIGDWAERPGLLTGALNPIYGPQLLFRTPVALMSAGLFGLFLVYFFIDRRDAFRRRAVRFCSVWSLAWTPIALAGALLYWSVVPNWVRDNVPVALVTMAFERWYQTAIYVILAAVAATAVISVWGAILPRFLPRAAMVAPFALCILLLGYFERVREFVRKPYAIANYVYSNGLRPTDYPLFKQTGLLTQATFVPMRIVGGDNRVAAGEEVFRIACTRCHTTTGVNGVVAKLTGLYGDKPWDAQAVGAYVRNMHNTRPYMPPAPGSDEELDALAAYLISLQTDPRPVVGAQTMGARCAPAESG